MKLTHENENACVRCVSMLNAPEGEHLTQTLEEIAMDKWKNMSHDSSFRSAYKAREKLLLDEQAKLAHAREEGLEEGKIQMIRSMHENGIYLEDIAKMSELSVEAVRRVIQ